MNTCLGASLTRLDSIVNVYFPILACVAVFTLMYYHKHTDHTLPCRRSLRQLQLKRLCRKHCK